MSTVLDSLNAGLLRAFRDNPCVFLLGEDILDPYGGAFKVTRNISSEFPERVIGTPISEAAIVGVATGLALRGFRPVVEIMFGDFTTLIVDQVVNHLSKYRSMYGHSQPLPVIIRTPMGGRRGYGPTHSQSLEKIFLGIPGFKVIAPNHYSGGAGELLYEAILHQDDPVLFVENKLQYLLKVHETKSTDELDIIQISSVNQMPVYNTCVHGAPPSEAVIITYGYMADLAQKAILKLAYQYEVFVDILVLTNISPLDIRSLGDCIHPEKNTLVLEEGPIGCGWGSEVVAQISEQYPFRKGKLIRVASSGEPIPASIDLESKALPQVDDILRAIMIMRGD